MIWTVAQRWELDYTDGRRRETKTAARPRQARGDGQNGAEALAVEILPPGPAIKIGKALSVLNKESSY